MAVNCQQLAQDIANLNVQIGQKETELQQLQAAVNAKADEIAALQAALDEKLIIYQLECVDPNGGGSGPPGP